MVIEKNKKAGAAVLLVLGLANMALQYLAGHPAQQHLFNADALYLPTLFADVLAHGGQLKDWFLTPAPYFFPDYPVFLLAYLAAPDPYGQILAFALIQLVLVFAATCLLAREADVAEPFVAAAAIAVVLAWLGLNAGEPLALILNSAFHYGNFLVSILLLACWMRYDREDGRRGRLLHLLMAGLAFAATLSDNLFLVQFVAPLIATCIVAAAARRTLPSRQVLPLLTVTLCSGLGSVSYKWAVANPTRYSTQLGFDKLSSNAQELYQLLHAALTGTPVLGVVFLVYLGVVLHALVRMVRRDKAAGAASWLAIFSFLSLCATLGAIALVTNIPITNRYLIPALSWPVIVVVVSLCGWLRARFVPAALAIALLAVLSMSLASWQLVRNNGIQGAFHPTQIACIDNVLEKEGLHNGIAQYWDAKYLQSFSRLDLTLAQHFDNLGEMPWITSKRFFRNSYDFAIVSEQANPPYKISSDILMRLNGPAKLVVACEGKTVHVYGKDKLRVRKLANVGDAYTWKACELPTIIGEKTGECEMRKKDNAQPGYVTFGPYESLPSGEYAFEIAYSSGGRVVDAVGDWDVVLALPNEAKVLGKGAIAGTGGEAGKVAGRFVLERGQDMEKIEIRTLARPDTDLEVVHIRVSRVR